MANKALIKKEKSEEDNETSKKNMKITSSGRTSVKPKPSEEFIEDFEVEEEEEEDEEDDDVSDESEYSAADALKDELNLREAGLWESDVLYYDHIKRGLLKAPNAVDITSKYVSF